jgi:hypothetical protein
MRSGEGTTDSPYTLAVSENGIETKHLKNNVITADKITNEAITTRHIENRSITMEKLSHDIFGMIIPQFRPEDLMPDYPNSIIVSDVWGHWRTQQIYKNEKILQYQWTTNSTGWVNLGVSEQTVPAGLYMAHVQINHEDTATPVDYVVVNAGAQSTYTFARKASEAQGKTISTESCLIYLPEHHVPVRLFLHFPDASNFGSASITLHPLIQLIKY